MEYIVSEARPRIWWRRQGGHEALHCGVPLPAGRFNLHYGARGGSRGIAVNSVVEVSRDLSLEMIRKARRISRLTQSAGPSLLAGTIIGAGFSDWDGVQEACLVGQRSHARMQAHQGFPRVRERRKGCNRPAPSFL